MVEAFNNNKPIYLQLAERIQHQIVRQERKMGEKLPSVREMAAASGVNPNTVQRTYQELERTGVVEMRRGQGSFVTEDEAILRDLREQMMAAYIATFVRDMHDLGFSGQEMVRGVEQYVEAQQTGRKRREGND